MIKKFLNVFMCLGLLMQNFAFVIPVMAQENDETSIDIVSITQGDDTLELKDGKYEVLGTDKITLNFKIINPKDNVDYDVKIIKNNTNNNYSGFVIDKESSDEIQTQTIFLDKNHQESDYTIKICELNNNWECVNEVDEKRFVLNLPNYNDLDYLNSKLIITKVEQGGKEITPTINDWSVTYNLNNIEDVELSFVGENLDDNTKYQFYDQYYSHLRGTIEYTGQEIENGIKYIASLNTFSQKGIQMVLNLGIYENIETSYKSNEGRYLRTNFEFAENEEINVSNIKVKHQNKELSFETDDEIISWLYGDIYKITPNEYDKTKPLTINVKAQSLEDKDYETEISVYRDKEMIFSKKVNVNGVYLNNGYDINLDDFILEMPTDIINNLGEYQIYVKVNNVTTLLNLLYKENGQLTRSLFYNTGEKTIIRHAGWGGIYGSGLVFEVSDKIFNEYKTMYIHYLGTDFENDVTYNYEFYYGENEKNKNLVTNGTITGKELNENGIMQAITDNYDYRFPAYMFVIKKGDNLVYYDRSEVIKRKAPVLTTIKVKSNNKNVYMQMSNYKYIATKNAPLTILFDGIGFDETKTYKYNLYDSYNNENVETYTISGRDINNGTASFKISKGNDELTLRNISIEVIGDDDYPISWGDIEIEYVDSKKYFPTDIPYVIDNAKDLIKSIKKGTNVNDFVASFNVNDDGNIKVYDNTGKTEITGNIGTGMIARITDEYDNNIMDLDVVVKGDVSGDGNISITDLVKVKRHLSKDDELTGVYEIAGNVSDTGKIGITDLVKISRDVAKIQEVQ